MHNVPHKKQNVYDLPRVYCSTLAQKPLFSPATLSYTFVQIVLLFVSTIYIVICEEQHPLGGKFKNQARRLYRQACPKLRYILRACATLYRLFAIRVCALCVVVTYIHLTERLRREKFPSRSPVPREKWRVHEERIIVRVFLSLCEAIIRV